ncbi:14547_t:CDS:2 [Dentiscutata erythropus]|uniref:14547_t:CDS:1 n=1 Tax=Dentiscutata erythropus TaxID=1348616 RepID=A0A9N9NUL1_9GLOM|nr:14547_t:CDS:2 [Dentiscutata erythropus]
MGDLCKLTNKERIGSKNFGKNLAKQQNSNTNTSPESKIILSTNSTFIQDIRFDHHSKPLWIQQVKRQDYADYEIGIDTLINIKFLNVALKSITPTIEQNLEPVLTEFILTKALVKRFSASLNTQTLPLTSNNTIKLLIRTAKMNNWLQQRRIRNWLQLEIE